MNKVKLTETTICLAGLLLLFFAGINSAAAYVIQDLPTTQVKNDFVLGPGKTELFLNPGDSATKELYITNRLGRDVEFTVDLEDFTGSRNPDEVVVLLGGKKGPYSLKDYLRPELNRFVLSHGQRMVLPVEIAIPETAAPGGLYGSVLVSAQPAPGSAGQGAAGGAALITRLGTLFFIRISGEVTENGALKKFSVKGGQGFFEEGPVPFEILFENNGSIHLSPAGEITISNLMGRVVDSISIDSWFAMPNSLRARYVNWERGFLAGRYTANLRLDRGYGGNVDTASVVFWVVPWKILLAGLGVLILVILVFRWVFSRIEIRVKPKENSS